MNYVDYILIVFLAIGFILGFRDGLIRKLVGIIGLVSAILLAYEFSDDFGLIISPYLNNEIYLAEIVGGILIFLITTVVFAIIKRLVHPLDKVNKLVNQLIGGIAGTIQIVFFLSAFLLLLNIFNLPANQHRNQSIFYQRIYNILPDSIDFILGSDSDAMSWLKKVIENKDQIKSSIDDENIEEMLEE